MEEKKITDQIREQVMFIYASNGNEEFEDDMYSIAIIHTLLGDLDKTIDNLRDDLKRLRNESLLNEIRLKKENEELKKKLEELKEKDKISETCSVHTDFSALLVDPDLESN